MIHWLKQGRLCFLVLTLRAINPSNPLNSQSDINDIYDLLLLHSLTSGVEIKTSPTPNHLVRPYLKKHFKSPKQKPRGLKASKYSFELREEMLFFFFFFFLSKKTFHSQKQLSTQPIKRSRLANRQAD